MSQESDVAGVVHLLLDRLGRSGHLKPVLDGMSEKDVNAALEIYDGVEAERRSRAKGWSRSSTPRSAP